jgi:prepilin-type processing-associated H-X9-DG protein
VSTNVKLNTKNSPGGCNPNNGVGPMKTVVGFTDPKNWLLNGCFAFRSPHTDGVNFVFCDGSVKFLRASITHRTYMALGSRAKGDMPGDY